MTDLQKVLEIIENKDWDSLVKFIKSQPDVCNAITVIVRDQNDDGKDFDKAGGGMLALHCAIINGAPLRVLEAIFAANPNAVRQRTTVLKEMTWGGEIEREGGDLALHLAIKHDADSDVVIGLLQVFPESATIKTPILNNGKDVKKSDGTVVHSIGGLLPLHLALECQSSSEVVKSLIKANTEAAKDSITTTGMLPLHYAAKNRASIEVVNELVVLFPQAVHEKTKMAEDSYGSPCEGGGLLALHFALMHKAPHAVIKALINAFPDSVKQKTPTIESQDHDDDDDDDDGASWSMPSFLQNDDDDGSSFVEDNNDDETDTNKSNAPPSTRAPKKGNPVAGGAFPLHVALKGQASEAVLATLLAAFPGAVKEKIAGTGESTLHCAVLHHAPAEIVLSIIAAYPGALRERTPVLTGKPGVEGQGCLPLHIGAKNKATAEVMAILIEKFPAAAKERSAVIFNNPPPYNDESSGGDLPIHIALNSEAHIDVLQMLLVAFPEGAKEKTHVLKDRNGEIHGQNKISGGLLPIHIAVKFPRLQQFVLKILEIFPVAIKEKTAVSGELPLHLALQHCASSEQVMSLLKAFPEAASEKSTGKGELPLHVALERGAELNVLNSLLSVYPASIREFTDAGALPLHVALGSTRISHNYHSNDEDDEIPIASPDLIKKLLSLYPDAIKIPLKRRFLSNGNDMDGGELPLHIAIKNEAPLKLVEILLAAYPESIKEKTPVLNGFYGDSMDGGELPLSLALYFSDGNMNVHKSSPDVVQMLLAAFPQATQQRTSNTEEEERMLPFHGLLKRDDLSNKFRLKLLQPAITQCAEHVLREDLPWTEIDAAIPHELKLFPEQFNTHEKDSDLPLSVICNMDPTTFDERGEKSNMGNLSGKRTDSGQFRLGNHSSRVVIKPTTTLNPTFVAAHLSVCQKIYYATPATALDHRDRDRETIVKNAESPAVRDWAKTLGTVYGRYILEDNGKPIYESNTCKVYYAEDVIKQKGDNNKRICIKVFQNELNFKSERNARKNNKCENQYFDEERVVSVLAEYSPDQGLVDLVNVNENFTAEEKEEKESDGSILQHAGGVNKEWAIIMPAGDKSLDRAIASENIAGNHDHKEEIVNIAQSLVKSIEHMHSKNMVHCDVKPRNFVRFGQQWKLIDLDAAKKKDVIMKNTNKFSSGYIPPEMARLLWTHKVGDKVKIKYSRTIEKRNNHRDLRGKYFDSYLQNNTFVVKEVWLKRTTSEEADKEDKRDIGDVRIGAEGGTRDFWFSRSDIINATDIDDTFTTENEFIVHESFDSWSFGVVLFQLCIGRDLFSDLGKSDDNLKDRIDQDRLMEWNERSLNAQLRKLGDDELGVKDLLRQCLHPNPTERPSMTNILTHKFFNETESGSYWKELDGSLAVPVTRGQTAVVAILGIVVFMFTCIHICMHVFPTSTINKLRAVLEDEVDYSGFIINFTTHELYNESVATWQTSTEQTLEAINTWTDFRTAAQELDSEMRLNFQMESTLVSVATFVWIAAAVFMAYCRKAFTSWPKVVEGDGDENENLLDEQIICARICTQWMRKLGLLYQDWRPTRSYAIKKWEFESEIKTSSTINKAPNSMARTVFVRERMESPITCCACITIPMYRTPKKIKGVTVLDLFIKLNVTGELKYIKHGGWPLDESKPLSTQIEENAIVFLVDKKCGHGIYVHSYWMIEKMFDSARWIFLSVLDFFRKHGDVDSEEELPFVFPDWWMNGNFLMLVLGFVYAVLNKFYLGHVIPNWHWVVIYTVAVVWASSCLYFYIVNSTLTLYKNVKLHVCAYLYSCLRSFYQHLPFVALYLHFVSPTMFFLAYAYDNMDYAKNKIYRPLSDAIEPVIFARMQIRHHKLGIIKNTTSGVNFLTNNETIRMAEQTLDQSCAFVIGAAAEVHTLLQIMVTGMMSDGSPNIAMYLLSYLIVLDGVKKMFEWGPKQVKKIAKWAQSGMEKDMHIGGIWQEFQTIHAANALFWLSDYVANYWLKMEPGDILHNQTVVTLLTSGLIIVCIAKLGWTRNYVAPVHDLGIFVCLAPFLLNYITGTKMFKLAVWFAVKYHQNPDGVWQLSF